MIFWKLFITFWVSLWISSPEHQPLTLLNYGIKCSHVMFISSYWRNGGWWWWWAVGGAVLTIALARLLSSTEPRCPLSSCWYWSVMRNMADINYTCMACISLNLELKLDKVERSIWILYILILLKAQKIFISTIILIDEVRDHFYFNMWCEQLFEFCLFYNHMYYRFLSVEWRLIELKTFYINLSTGQHWFKRGEISRLIRG